MGFILTMMLGTFFALQTNATANSLECGVACQHSKGLKSLAEEVADFSQHGPQSKNCPAGGIKIVEGQQVETGSLMGASGSIENVLKLANQEALNLARQNTLCGSCRQVNEVTPFTVTRPIKVKESASCVGRPTQSFRADFANTNDAKDYVKKILDGKNQQGQALYAGCPDPCSFYVYNGQKTDSSGRTKVTLTVQCGQPRSGGALFSKYQYSYGNIQEWVCSNP